MNSFLRIGFGALALLSGNMISTTQAQVSSPTEDFKFYLRATFQQNSFDEGAAEIGAYDPITKKLFFVNAKEAAVIILDLSNGLNVSESLKIDVSAEGGAANSVAVANGLVAVAVEANNPQDNGKVVVYNTDGVKQWEVTVGALPDMVVFTPDGTKILVTNEGEPNDEYTVDPEGSVSIIDVATRAVQTVGFSDFNEGGSRASELPDQVRIFGPNASVAQDLEPEYITVNNDGTKAWVALQENNAIAVIDIAAASIDEIWALGYKDYSLPQNKLDPSDRDGGINIANWPVFGMYQPDAITYFEVDGTGFIATANEGDARDYDGFSEEVRIKNLTLDLTVFPDAENLQLDENLGRLRTTTANGNTNGDGAHEQIFIYGGRSFAIWNASTGALVYDSGSQIEEFIASVNPDNFNSNNDEQESFEARSDDKGPEPEAVEFAILNGKPHILVGLERQGGVLAYDVSNPEAPIFVNHINNRDFAPQFDADSITPDILSEVGDLGPEDVIFIPAADSPSGHQLMVVLNEVSGSVSFFEVITPIAVARGLESGAIASIEGLVVNAAGRITRVIDESGKGLSVFQSSGSLRDAVDADPAGVDNGDYIRLTGAASEFNGLNQLVNPEEGSIAFDVIARENPLPAPLTASLFDIVARGEDFESQLVIIRNVTINSGGDTEFQASTNYSVTDPSYPEGERTLNLRIQNASSGESGNWIGKPIPTGPITFVGTIGEFRGSHQLLPVDDNDIRETPGVFTLTLLHNNDGESQLVDGGRGIEEFGGVARFKTLVDSLRAQGNRATNGTVLVSSGDNFLAGPEFNISLNLQDDEQILDARALELIDYDAIVIGNHDFDFGPEVLARFIEDTPNTTFLSANLGFDDEPELKVLADANRIAPRTKVTVGEEEIGIIGATTTELRSITSSRNVSIDFDLLKVIQAQIDALESEGVNKIMLISHLQSISEDTALVGKLKGIDIMIAGGGSEVLANENALLVPGDIRSEDYPIVKTDSEGNDVLIVTTQGNYKYVGRLVIEFDEAGNVVAVGEESNPVRVASTSFADGVEPNATLVSEVQEPIVAGLAALRTNIIAKSEVALDGIRSNVRTKETNLGNLITDAYMWQATKLAAEFGVKAPDVAFANGGGIRNDAEIVAGDITELDTFDILPFSNFLVIMEDIPVTVIRNVLENAVSAVEFGSGRFAQMSGISVEYNPAESAMNIDNDTGEITAPGQRVISATLDDGTQIIRGGDIVDPTQTLTVATVNFTARGGDEYPWEDADFVTLGVTYQRTLFNFINAEDGLDGFITAANYPEGGEGRIKTTTLTPVEQSDLNKPVAFTLGQNFPNPFNPSTNINFSIPQAADVRLDVFDMLGRKVAQLINERRSAGAHTVQFDARNLASGMYIYRISAGSFTATRKMTLIK